MLHLYANGTPTWEVLDLSSIVGVPQLTTDVGSVLISSVTLSLVLFLVPSLLDNKKCRSILCWKCVGIHELLSKSSIF